MKRNRLITLLLCGALTFTTALTACGKTTATSDTLTETVVLETEIKSETAEPTSHEAYAGQTITGQLTAIDGNTIAVQTMNSGDSEQNANDETQELPAGENTSDIMDSTEKDNTNDSDSESSEDGNVSELPESENSSANETQSEDHAASYQTSKTITISLADDIEILDLEGNTISISSLTAGKYVTITFDNAGYVSQMQIINSNMIQ